MKIVLSAKDIADKLKYYLSDELDVRFQKEVNWLGYRTPEGIELETIEDEYEEEEEEEEEEEI